MSDTSTARSQPPGEPTPRREPRPSFSRAVLDAIITGNSAVITFLAIVVALFLGGVLIALSDPDVLPKVGYFFARPSDALTAAWQSVAAAYYALFRGAIVDPSSILAYVHGTGSFAQIFNPVSETLVAATPLILAGLAVAISFRSGLFNIGAQGQIVTGGLLAGWLGFAVHLPIVIHVLVALAGGIVGGAVFGGIAGWLKARTGAHEVITTIMLNYIAFFLLLYLLHSTWFQRPGRTDPISPVLDTSAQLPPIFGSSLRVSWGIVAALLAAAGVAWLLDRSTLGFEFRAVGLNPDAARTAGMSVPRVYVLVMLVSGGLAGLAGGTYVQGTQHFISPGLHSELGFTAITVALLGRNTPLGTVLAGLLFGALQAGGTVMQAATGTPVDVVTVIQALIVIFIATPPLVRAIFRLRGRRVGGETEQMLSKGWGG
ncbi:MAG: ABC transporter permease [Streptosporangiaceae bacterium]